MPPPPLPSLLFAAVEATPLTSRARPRRCPVGGLLLLDTSRGLGLASPDDVLLTSGGRERT